MNPKHQKTQKLKKVNFVPLKKCHSAKKGKRGPSNLHNAFFEPFFSKQSVPSTKQIIF